MAQSVITRVSFQFYIGLISAIGIVANAMLLPALPFIAQEFGASSCIAEWTMTAFLLGATLGQFLWGPLSDCYGRRRPLYWGFCIAILASLMCYHAYTPAELLIGRFLQGFGATSGNSIARALSRDCYEGALFTRMIARIFTIIPLAAGIAPLLGDSVNLFWGWRSSFLLMAAFAAGVLWLTFHFLRRMPQRLQRLSVQAIAQEYFLVLRDPVSLATLGCIASIFVGFFIFLTSLPFFVHRLGHFQKWEISLALVLFPCGIFAGGFYQSNWGWLKPWKGVLRVCWILIGLALILDSLTLFLGGPLLMPYIGFMMFFGGSMSIVNSLSSTFLLQRYPPAVAGTLSSILGVTQTLASALGSYLVILAPSPLSALGLISMTTVLCYSFYLFFRNQSALPGDT